MEGKWLPALEYSFNQCGHDELRIDLTEQMRGELITGFTCFCMNSYGILKENGFFGIFKNKCDSKLAIMQKRHFVVFTRVETRKFLEKHGFDKNWVDNLEKCETTEQLFELHNSAKKIIYKRELDERYFNYTAFISICVTIYRLNVRWKKTYLNKLIVSVIGKGAPSGYDFFKDLEIAEKIIDKHAVRASEHYYPLEVLLNFLRTVDIDGYIDAYNVLVPILTSMLKSDFESLEYVRKRKKLENTNHKRVKCRNCGKALILVLVSYRVFTCFHCGTGYVIKSPFKEINRTLP